jgi:hypothetical protein
MSLQTELKKDLADQDAFAKTVKVERKLETGEGQDWAVCPTCGRKRPTNVIEPTTAKERADHPGAAEWACDADRSEWSRTAKSVTDSGPKPTGGSSSAGGGLEVLLEPPQVTVLTSLFGTPQSGQETRSIGLSAFLGGVDTPITKVDILNEVGCDAVYDSTLGQITVSNFTADGGYVDLFITAGGVSTFKQATFRKVPDVGGVAVDETKNFAPATYTDWVKIVQGVINTDGSGKIVCRASAYYSITNNDDSFVRLAARVRYTPEAQGATERTFPKAATKGTVAANKVAGKFLELSSRQGKIDISPVLAQGLAVNEKFTFALEVIIIEGTATIDYDLSFGQIFLDRVQ